MPPTVSEVVQGRRSDAQMEHAQVSVPGNVWTTVLSFTPGEDRLVTSFDADVIGVVSLNYMFRLRLDAVVKWHEVASTTAVANIVSKVLVPVGSVLDIQVYHVDAVAQNCGASISHESPALS